MQPHGGEKIPEPAVNSDPLASNLLQKQGIFIPTVGVLLNTVYPIPVIPINAQHLIMQQPTPPPTSLVPSNHWLPVPHPTQSTIYPMQTQPFFTPHGSAELEDPIQHRRFYIVI